MPASTPTAAYVSTRQHTVCVCVCVCVNTCKRTAAYVSIRQDASAYGVWVCGCKYLQTHSSSTAANIRAPRCNSLQGSRNLAYVSIRQHTSAYVSIRQRMSAYVSVCQRMSTFVSVRRHTSRAELQPLRIQPLRTQHTSACVSIRQRTSAYVTRGATAFKDAAT